MLHVEIIHHGRTIALPALPPGAPPASLTDHQPAGTHLLLITCLPADQGAELAVSRAGLTVEQADWRLVHSLDLVLERALGCGETYERPVRTRRGMATLRLRHVPEEG
jgi:hypothetical protein